MYDFERYEDNCSGKTKLVRYISRIRDVSTACYTADVYEFVLFLVTGYCGRMREAERLVARNVDLGIHFHRRCTICREDTLSNLKTHLGLWDG